MSSSSSCLWLEVPSYPEFRVNNLGEVMLMKNGQITTGSNTTAGYRTVRTKNGINVYVHRLVCSAFYGVHPNDQPFVNHKDGIKDNNTSTNVEWCSPKENSQHAWVAGLINNRKAHLIWDILYNEFYESESLGAAIDILDGSASAISLSRKNRALYKNRYFIKYQTDNMPLPDLNVLRSDFIKYKRLSTGETAVFLCRAEASKRINVDFSLLCKYLELGRQYLNGYLIKRYGDDTPWFEGRRLKKAINKSGIGIVMYSPLHGFGYYSPSTLRAHGCFGFTQAQINRSIQNEQQYLGNGVLVKRVDNTTDWLSIDIVERKLFEERRFIVAIDRLTGQHHPARTITELSRYINVPGNTIRYRIKTNNLTDVKGFDLKWSNSPT